MADFAGTITEIANDSWRASGLLSVDGGKVMFDTVCKPRTFSNEAAGQAFLLAWALKHNASAVIIDVERLSLSGPT